MMRINIVLAALLIMGGRIPAFGLTGKEDVSFKSGAITLKGSLFIPNGEGPFPAVVFVHGSGAETRENSIHSAKWFASIGYVALAYDKRGAGESEGDKMDWVYFSPDTLAADVEAAINFLKTRNKVDQAKIGLLASSQGGWIAPLVASKSGAVSFMVIRSASVTTIGEDRIFERSARLMKEGFTNEQIEEATRMQKAEPKVNDDREDEFSRLFFEYKEKTWFKRVYAGDTPFTESLLKYRKWYASVVDFDPLALLEGLDLPVLWLFGDARLDTQGPVEKSIANLQKLQKMGKPYEILSLKGEGHNIREKAYETKLFDWLAKVNNYNVYKFRKH